MSGDQELMEVDVGTDIPNRMIISAGALMIMGFLLGLVPAVASGTTVAAERFMDARGYADAVLGGRLGYPPVEGPLPPGWDAHGLVISGLTVLAAAAVAAVAVLRTRLPAGWQAPAGLERPSLALRRLHSGRVGDYVVWLLIGVGFSAAVLVSS